MSRGNLYLWLGLILTGILIRVILRMRARSAAAALSTSLIGKTGDVIETIGPGRFPGRIRIEGREFPAISDRVLEAGSFGEVVAIDKSNVTVVQVPALSSHTTGYHMMEM